MTQRIVRLAPWIVLLAAVLVVELGGRAAEPNGVELAAPRFATPMLDRLRAAPFAAIADPRSAAVVSGVVLGRTEAIDTATQTVFLDSGLWHLLAASGQNVGLLAMICITVARGVRAPRLAGVLVAVGAIVLYVMVVGGGASILRAGVLAVVLLLAWALGRSADARHVLVVTAALICAIWPGAHRGLGMQLSYACVAVLMWKCEEWTRWLTSLGVWSWFAGLLAASALCGLATAPILALRTGSAPLTGTVANVVAVPLAGALLVVGLAGVVLWSVGLGSLGAVVLTPAGWMANVLARIAQRAAELPAAQIDDRLALVAVPVLIGCIVLINDHVRARTTRRVGVRLAAVAAAIVICWALAAAWAPRFGITGLPGGAAVAPPRPPHDLRMAVLDIGQGDSTLLATDAGAILVDVGPPDGEVVRRVRQLGVRRLEGIVLTHDSLDHRGGYESALAQLHPRWIAKPLHAPGPWRRIVELAPTLHELCDGSSLDLGSDVHIDVRNPPCDGHVIQRTSDIHNDGALVLVIRHHNVTMVIPADAEAPVLRRLDLPHVDVLRVSHHGSSDPDLPLLLERIQPAVAAISVGAGNDYGHPRADTLHALDAAGVRTFRTDRDGSVVFDSDGARVHVELVRRSGR
jgi:competence protein ComEC